MDDDLVANFVGITGATEQMARQLLEIANGDLQQAAVLFYDTDMAEALARQPAADASTSIPTSVAATTAHATSTSRTASSSRYQSRRAAGRPAPRTAIGHEDRHGVIHIEDSDDDGADFEEIDDDDDDMDDNFHDAQDSQMSDAAAAESVARNAQEEEDEAMAKRLQEEMYSETATTSDGIRAPMGRTTEVLVEPSYGGGGYSDYAEQTFLDQMRRRRQARAPNPFNQVWDDDAGAGGSSSRSSSTAPQTSRQARLADLFRPPYDLMEHMSWDEARSVGKEEKRWILANMQDMSDFQCQALNRDIWKDEAVKQLVKENFIFLQYNKGDASAESYIQYYMPGGQHENPDNYPHVAIIDPRTGEQVKVWSGRPFPNALDFHAQLAEFLDRYSLDLTKKNPVQRTKPQQAVKDVGRMTEDEMLEMALRNSLETAGAENGSGDGSSSVSRPSVQDPDELTAAPESGKGKEKAADEAEDEAEGMVVAGGAAASAAFARIPSDRPHAEPANNPATTTRIQFRHPTGRVIRRFAVGDSVVRIYEWLKAEPLEGKSGLEFELKVMPQGHDLLEDLDKTIEEAGLKQATVMIEFLEG